MPGPATVSKSISGFDPRSVTGCQLWLDAADSSSVTGTTTVTAWRDKSGNARNLSVGSGTTSYASNAITLASSYMVVTSAVDLTNFTFFIVSRSNGAIYNQTVFGARPNTSAVYNSTDGFGFYMDNQTAIRLYGTLASGSTLVSFAAGTSVANVFSFQSGSTIINAWLNGTSLTAANSLGTRTSTAQGFAIGGEWQGSAYGNIISTASINEIIVYNTTLSTSQRQAIEGYLAWKWGIETVSTRNLVVGHPFYYNRPFTRDFQPVDIPNCTMWLDGKDTSTMTPLTPSSGTSITAWRDKSSNSVSYVNGGAGIIPNYSAYSLAAPTYVSGGGILFNPSLSGTFTNGTTQGFVAVGGFPLNMTGFTTFVIARANGTTISSYNSYFSWYSGAPQFVDFDANGSAGYTSMYTDSGGININYQTNYTLTNAVTIQCLQGTPTGAATYINGNVSATSSYAWSYLQTGTSVAIDVWIGNQAPGNRTFSGTIYEMILYDTILTLAQRQQVEGYLAWKWGIRTTLPATHPFYTYPPSSVSLFLPTQVLGCSLWLDGVDPYGTGTLPANGTGINAWIDKSGCGNYATAFTSINAITPTNPTVVTNSLNGLPGISFPGTSGMRCPPFLTFSSAAVFIVVNFTGANTNAVFEVWKLKYSSLLYINTGSLYVGVNSTGAYSISSQVNYTNTYGTPYLLGMTLNASSVASSAFTFVASVNGTATTNTGTSTSGNPAGCTDYIGIGVDVENGIAYYPMSGTVYEIIVYNQAILPYQRIVIEGYLAWKWGLQRSLPSTHPYKLFSPSQFTPVNTIATGGTITITPSVKYHTFTSSGSFVFTSGVTTLNYLIVGGGGGGGDRHGGGGGAGGVISGTFSPTATTYTVTVGLGGAGGYYEANNSSPRGSGLKGGDSSISGVATAYGGGGGGTYDGNPTGTFGSGGGGGGNNLAGIAGTTGQGNSGGSGLIPGAGGGGGAGGAGVAANTSTGGVGTTSYTTQLLSIGYGTSFAVATSPNSVVVSGIAYIAGGGGGAAAAGPGPGGTGGLGGGGRGDWDIAYISGGTANTGGGGGGSRSLNEPSYGYAGGSGLVVIWYAA